MRAGSGDERSTEQRAQALAKARREERLLLVATGVLVCVIAVGAVDRFHATPVVQSLPGLAVKAPSFVQPGPGAVGGSGRVRERQPPPPARATRPSLDLQALSANITLRLSKEAGKLADAPKQGCSIPGCDIRLDYPFAVVCLTCQKIVFVTLGGSATPNFWAESKETLAFILTEQNSGEVFSNEVGNITNLNWLVLSNAVYGTIPTVLGNLDQLAFLHIQSNSLEGPLPTEMGRMSSLSSLTVTDSHVSGSLANEVFLSQQLKYIDLSQNELGGSLPAQLFNRRLDFFSAAENHLEGSIPSQFGLMTDLFGLVLEKNNLDGTLPSQLGVLAELTTLNLQNNELISGSIPSQLGTLTKLSVLSLHGASINGTIPSQLGCLTELASLSLSGNALTGTIPSWLGRLSLLTELQLYENELSSSIPTQLGLLTNLETLRLHDNQLSGPLPNQFVALTALTTLDVSYNTLSGQLPEGLDTSVVQCEGSGLLDAQCALPATDDREFLDDATFYGVCGVVAVSLFLSLGLVVFVVVFRERAVVASSGLWFALATLAGTILVAASVVPYGVGQLDRAYSERRDACRVFASLFVHGIVLVLAAVFARNFGIMKRDGENKPPPSIKQVRLVVLAVLIDLVFVTPVSVETVPKTEFGCKFDRSPLLYPSFVYVIVLALAACFTSFKIRHVESSHQDTQSVAKATYTILTFGVAMMVLSYTTSDPRSQFLSLSLSVLLCAITFVLVVHGPKVVRVVKGQGDDPSDAPRVGATALWSNSLQKNSHSFSGASGL